MQLKTKANGEKKERENRRKKPGLPVTEPKQLHRTSVVRLEAKRRYRVGSEVAKVSSTEDSVSVANVL